MLKKSFSMLRMKISSSNMMTLGFRVLRFSLAARCSVDIMVKSIVAKVVHVKKGVRKQEKQIVALSSVSTTTIRIRSKRTGAA
jgi:hypothetical protein